MRRAPLLSLLICVAGCSSNPSTQSAPSTPTTELAGTWNTTGTGTVGSMSASGTFQVKLVSSPCSVSTPVGMISVQGTVCFIANNNSGYGGIMGTSISPVSKSLGQGILVGVAADPVPDKAAINLVFVSSKSGAKTFQEFTGTATITAGKMTGSGACNSASTASCQGASATFTATPQ